jgi:predicted DNA-binding protein
MPRPQEIEENLNGDRVTVTLRLPLHMWEDFKALAYEDGRSAAGAVRYAMRGYMEAQNE